MNDSKNNKQDFEILRRIAKNPNSSQRELSRELGYSLGKLNYCLKALQKKGLIKIKNFKKNKKKINYIYILTPQGISVKAKLAINFMKRMMKEYDSLSIEKKIPINKNSLIGHNSKNFDVEKKIEVEENKTRTKPIFKTIEVNIKRRTVIVNDVLSKYNGKPIPSWIELSIIDVCNRKCSFCPKVDPKIAPDTYQRMQLSLIDKLCNELTEMKYKGSVVLCGYGEPMLHKEVNIICKKLSEVSFVEIVTNGDTLSPKIIKNLYANNVNKLLISMYDGEHQIEKFNKMIEKAKVPKDFVILRDRWYDSSKDYGLKLTNRTGTINIGEQEKVGTFTKCFLTAKYARVKTWTKYTFRNLAANLVQHIIKKSHF